MQQLSGLDTLFLRCELGNTYLHIGPVMVYTPPAGKGEPGFEDILSFFGERLDRSDVFRRKLVEVPWKLDNPYWIEDPDFNLENHVHQTRLPKPGNRQQLFEEIARLHACPLDRAHPLWAAHIIYGLDDIEGLPTGSFAIYFKTQHATMDGATGSGIVEAVHDKEPHGAGESPEDQWEGESEPLTLSLLSRAVVNNIRQPFKLAGVIGQAVPAVARVVKGTIEERYDSPEWRERTRFNGPIGPERVCGFIEMGLSDVKAMRKLAPGATLNDVMLTIISGAMRSYLEAKGELPGKSLVTGVPVDVRDQQQQGGGGNIVSMMAVSLCSDIEDPLERLKCVHQQTRASKSYHDVLGSDLIPNLCDAFAPYLLAACSGPVIKNGLLGKIPTIFNTVVTNVPGPHEPLFLGDSQMKMILGLGPVLDGIGLFHTVSSCGDILTIGFQACPTILPDPEFYTSCIQEVYDELKKA